MYEVNEGRLQAYSRATEGPIRHHCVDRLQPSEIQAKILFLFAPLTLTRAFIYASAMASGATGFPPLGAFGGGATAPIPMLTDTGATSPAGDPRRKKRPGAQSPGPAAYDPPADASAEDRERAMKSAIDDHKARIMVVTQVLAVVGKRLDEHDHLLAKVDSNDSEIKAKLGSLEDQIVANDKKLKEDLCTLESKVTTCESKVATIAQALEAGAIPAQGDEQSAIAARLKKIETHVDSSIKGLEVAVQQMRVDYNQRDEELFARFQTSLVELTARVAEIELSSGPAAAPRSHSTPGYTAPPTAPHGADPWSSQPGTFGPRQSWHQNTQGASADGAKPGMSQDEIPQFPKFDAQQRSSAAFHHVGGDRKTLFEDKVAISPVGQYRDEQKHEWLESTRNYLISKAFEMDAFLRWAESAQAVEITHAHVGWLSQSSFCSDHEPHRLSRDLWGYLNLCLSGKQKLAFNNVPKGNGFEAWRRITLPIAPRSEARLHEMHGDVHRPPSSKRLAEVMGDIDRWENMLVEFYRCGGEPLTDKTKVIIAMKMLPSTTPASLKMALKGIYCFEKFKDELRQNIKFLEDFSGPAHMAQANMAAEYAAMSEAVSATDSSIPVEPELGEAEEITERDLPAFVMQSLSAADRQQLVLAVNQRRFQNRRGAPGQKPGQPRRPRPSTPPRSAQDIKCANCGAPGHSAQACPKPRIPLEERKCHKCGKTGHIASRCPDKQARANIAEAVAPLAITDRPGRVLMITDDEGFTAVPFRRSAPPPPTVGDFVRPPRVSQGQRRRAHANRFVSLGCGCADPACEESSPHSGAVDDARVEADSERAQARQSPPTAQPLSAATRFIIGPDYTSECPVCDGSECDGTCGVADLRDFEDSVPPAISLGSSSDHAVWEAIPDPVVVAPGQVANVTGAADAVSLRAESNHSINTTAQAADNSSAGHSHRTEEARGYLAISAEPNINDGMTVELPSARRDAVERIRAQIGPDRMAALEALDMADEFVSQALLMEDPDDMGEDILNVEWVDLDIEVALDSGCCDHVMDVETEAPGYEISDSASSRRGGCFIVGNGERITNDGEAMLNLETGGGPGQTSQVQRFQSTFQAARVTRPLMSVSRVCSNGFRCVFDAQKAQILDKDGQEVCVFERKGGLYVSRMRLKSPSPFGGPGR